MPANFECLNSLSSIRATSLSLFTLDPSTGFSIQTSPLHDKALSRIPTLISGKWTLFEKKSHELVPCSLGLWHPLCFYTLLKSDLYKQLSSGDDFMRSKRMMNRFLIFFFLVLASSFLLPKSYAQTVVMTEEELAQYVIYLHLLQALQEQGQSGLPQQMPVQPTDAFSQQNFNWQRDNFIHNQMYKDFLQYNSRVNDETARIQMGLRRK